MKTDKRIPTPLELLQFAKETGIFDRFGTIPSKVGFGQGLAHEANEAFFFEAYSRWDEWEYFIRCGAQELNRAPESDKERKPLVRVLKEMAVREERTLRKYYDMVSPLESWSQAKTKGFYPWVVQEMIQVRDKIAKERAQKGAAGLHAKGGKKFEQGK